MSEKIELASLDDALRASLARVGADLVAERVETDARLLARSAPVCLVDQELLVLASCLDGAPPADDLCGLQMEHFGHTGRAIAFGALRHGIDVGTRLDRPTFARLLCERRYGGLGALAVESLLHEIDQRPVLVGARLRHTCREMIAVAGLNDLHRTLGVQLAGLRAGARLDPVALRAELRGALTPLSEALKSVEECV